MTDPNFKKISAMTALAAAAADDIIPIIDVSEALDSAKNKTITTANLRKDITNAELAGSITAAKIAGLSVDPNADRIAFWDDGAGSLAYLEPGAGLTITDTTIDLDHLGIEDLADPGADRIGFWDDSAGKMDWLIPGTGLTIADKTINAGGMSASEINDAAVTYAKIQNVEALSVVGRSAATAGVSAGITAGSDGHVLRRAGTTIGFGTVAAAGLATDAVETLKIKDANVTVAKMAANSVDSANIVAGAVDLAHMSVNSVDSDQYVDGSIDTAHIADANVTPAKTSFFNSNAVGGGIFAGRVAANGTAIRLPSGWTSERTSAGAYTITHNLGVTTYSVVLTLDSGVGVDPTVWEVQTNYFKYVTVTDAAAGLDRSAHFILVRYE